MKSSRPWRPAVAPVRGRVIPTLIALVLTVLTAATATAQPQPTTPQPPPHFAITNARIVPVSGPVLESGTIVVRDGVIRAVGVGSSVPGDAWVLDGSGLTVYPGLIDAFGHPGSPRSSGEEARPAGRISRTPGVPEDRPATFTWRSAADELDASDPRIAAGARRATRRR
jgi:hypothetical protein